MMRIAVIADIHSNVFALEAVLEDIKGRSADLTVCTGDLVGYCPFPNEVIDMIRNNNILTIMGNYDEAVGNELLVCGCDYPDPKDAENAAVSLNWTIDETTEDNKAYLRDLPAYMLLDVAGNAFRFVHGSPRQNNEYLKLDSRESEAVMGELAEDILICGHTHKPYYKYYGKKLLINAGSVGKPKTGNPRANYVIVGIHSDKTRVEIVEVSYDHEKTAVAIENSGLPNEFAELIRTGRP